MSPRKSKRTRQHGVTESLEEYGRGVAGGLMFSLPLLYTMEMWWAGFIAHPYRLVAYMLATFVLLLGYNRFAGLRRDASMAEVAIDSVEEMGIGILLAALVLFLLGRISFEMPISETAGLIAIQAMTVAIGVSIGTAQLGAGGKEDEGLTQDSASQPQQSSNDSVESNKKHNPVIKKEVHFGGQMVLALLGAVLFAANLAPTEEIVVIAIESSWLNLVGLAVFSLLIAFLVLHYSDFKGADEFVSADHPTIVLLGTVLTYAIALCACASILFFFGRFDGVTMFTALAQTITLAVGGTLGASAGRLLLQ